MVKNVHHMWQAYGGWTFAFDDYYKLNFTGELDDPQMQQVAHKPQKNWKKKEKEKEKKKKKKKEKEEKKKKKQKAARTFI